jgi:hypothetical protein
LLAVRLGRLVPGSVRTRTVADAELAAVMSAALREAAGAAKAQDDVDGGEGGEGERGMVGWSALR